MFNFTKISLLGGIILLMLQTNSSMAQDQYMQIDCGNPDVAKYDSVDCRSLVLELNNTCSHGKITQFINHGVGNTSLGMTPESNNGKHLFECGPVTIRDGSKKNSQNFCSIGDLKFEWDETYNTQYPPNIYLNNIMQNGTFLCVILDSDSPNLAVEIYSKKTSSTMTNALK